MKLLLNINGAESHLDMLAPGPECRFRLDGGPERAANVQVTEPGVYSVLMDGRSYEARVEQSGGMLIATVAGWRFEVELHDPRAWARKSGSRGGAGIETVTAPMPGKVVRVLVAPGDAVEAGQGLVVVEAMKMQNEMKASRAGRVLAVPANEGATVAAGEVLASIE
jgi:biotin carboxyl carrier protein